MLKKIILSIVLQGSAMLFAQEGVLKIEVKDSITGEKLEFANVLLESAGVVARTGTADVQGDLVFKNLPSGSYKVKTKYSAYPTKVINGVIVSNEKTTYLEVQLSSNILKDVVIADWKKPLVEPVPITRCVFVRQDIAQSMYTTPEQFATMVPGAVQPREGEGTFFRGQRDNGVAYIIDGQRVIGSHAIPKSAIEQMTFTFGGIPAKYGDATGAFIEIETRSGLVNSRR